ncbi:MAG: signal peptidase II, partial [Armatimonadota bacterium]
VGLELGGAVGNLIDRIRFRYVVDFIDLRVWPVFNIADVAITIGLFLLAYYVFVNEPHRYSADKSIQEESGRSV